MGKLLKARRVHDHEDAMESYFTVGLATEDLESVKDPADADTDLSSKLRSQHEKGKVKMEQVRFQGILY